MRKLLLVTVAALLWANSPWPHSYESVWTTQLSIRLGHSGISQDLRHWVNEGLMTFFFLVVGLEAKRELDVGQLRDRRRVAIPFVAAIGGMAGDRGLLHPELPESALRDVKADLTGRSLDACVSSNRTCELALQQVTGRQYASFVFLLEELTRTR